jgi:hypothetical protein
LFEIEAPKRCAQASANKEQPSMNNPIMHELVAREQHNDRLREVERTRLVSAAMAYQPARRVDLRAAIATLSALFGIASKRWPTPNSVLSDHLCTVFSRRGRENRTPPRNRRPL